MPCLLASVPYQQVERRGSLRGGFHDASRSKIQAMKEIKVRQRRRGRLAAEEGQLGGWRGAGMLL